MILKLENRIIINPDVIELRFQSSTDAWWVIAIKGERKYYIEAFETQKEAQAELYFIYENIKKEMPNS